MGTARAGRKADKGLEGYIDLSKGELARDTDEATLLSARLSLVFLNLPNDPVVGSSVAFRNNQGLECLAVFLISSRRSISGTLTPQP